MTHDPLRDLKSKIEWAKSNVADLEVAIGRFFEDNPLVVEKDIYPERGVQVHKLVMSRPIAVHIEGRVNNIVHDLRTTLDYLACALARLNGHTNVSGTYFPLLNLRKYLKTQKCREK